MIFTSAYFRPHDECDKFGQIIFADGSESVVLVSKSQALEFAESQIGVKIDKAELLVLKEQIHKSNLKNSDEHLEKISLKLQSEIHELIRKIFITKRN